MDTAQVKTLSLRGLLPFQGPSLKVLPTALNENPDFLPALERINRIKAGGAFDCNIGPIMVCLKRKGIKGTQERENEAYHAFGS